MFLSFLSGMAQPEVIDRVIAVVGKYPILLSDLQSSMLQRENQGMAPDKCRAFEMLLYQKLLVAQADRDSITVSDAEVDQELSRRMAFFIQQFGSEEKLEAFYGKRTNVIKDELRSDVQEQMLAERMAGRISGDTKVSPAEIREYYNSMPEDSLPLVESEVELQQLVRKPMWSKEAKQEAKELLESYRQRVLKGQTSMSTLARLYSEDPGSAREGGIYRNVSRGTMEPAFDATAFRLKNGEISEVFETSFGYHFIELVQRKGEVVDLRHILIIPKMTASDFFNCKRELDSLYTEINDGKLSFEEAVKKYSDDKDTKQNAGLMINPKTASTKFDNEILSQLDQNLIVTLAGMEIGQISKPMEFTDMDGKRAYRIIKLKNRIDPHRTNLKDDYQKLAGMATAEKNRKLVKDWIKKRSAGMYIKLDTGFECNFENEWRIAN
ncbi:MAG: peptidylprolyl isomerase [Bacteroidia bacterium]|nr:peptidylprolyl isomerase [Bacteroidia bacterium]